MLFIPNQYNKKVLHEIHKLNTDFMIIKTGFRKIFQIIK